MATTLRELRAAAGETVRTARTLASLKRGRNDWFRFENNATHETSLFIYDEIGYFGVTAADFGAAFRNEVDQNDALTVHINSPGGSVFDGIAILNTLRSHKGGVTTIVDGIAASAASFIAQAGTKRVMARNSEMMIHDASGLCIGNAAEMRETADLLDRASDNLADIYASRSGRGTVQDWRAILQKEVWYSAQEAVDAGLADEVDGTEEEPPAATWDLSVFAHKNRKEAPEPVLLSTPPIAASAKSFDFSLFKKGLQRGC
jgi:ATP-dependent Clp endopeptidase proteolytic subunit ClpP